MKDNSYYVRMGIGGVSFTGCEKHFYHVSLHPDLPDTKWCMLCFGERFGVDLMNIQRKPKLDCFIGGYSHAELWEHPIEYFTDIYVKPTNKLTLADFKQMKDTPEYINDMIDGEIK